MRPVIATSLLLLLATAARAEDPQAPAAPPPAATPVVAVPALAEADAHLLEKLALQRQVMEEKFRRLQADAQRIQAELPQLQQEYQAKTREFEMALEAAAKKAGVDPKLYKPDVGSRTWRKAE